VKQPVRNDGKRVASMLLQEDKFIGRQDNPTKTLPRSDPRFKRLNVSRLAHRVRLNVAGRS
jgi:hypothetical protein